MKIIDFKLDSYRLSDQIASTQLSVLEDNRITYPVEIIFSQNPNELPIVRANTNNAIYKAYDHLGHGYTYPTETREGGALTFQTQLRPGPILLIIVENKGLNENRRSIITGTVV